MTAPGMWRLTDVWGKRSRRMWSRYVRGSVVVTVAPVLGNGSGPPWEATTWGPGALHRFASGYRSVAAAQRAAMVAGNRAARGARR